ncbi:MAG: hypothetical protein RTV31_01475 [Candidatus Thorarchaeota archaeon]
MSEDRSMNDQKKCSNCGSENIIGPYDIPRDRIYFGYITSVARVAYICADCLYTMYFIRHNDRDKVNKEAQKAFSRYQ